MTVPVKRTLSAHVFCYRSRITGRICRLFLSCHDRYDVIWGFHRENVKDICLKKLKGWGGLNLDPSNLMKALKMTTLSPKIQEMIMSGDIPDTMTLTKFYSDFPEDWEAQEQHFGMKEETVS